MKFFVKRLQLTAVTIAAVLGLFLIQGRTPAMVAATGAPTEDGATLFKAKCAACHGPDASGHTPMGTKLGIKDLRSAEVQAKSDTQLFNTISNGQNKMPGYKSSLSPEQIHQLVAFIRAQGKKS